MEQTIHSPETYDFRKYDQIWQRVAPNLEPYPDLREPAVPAVPPLPSGGTASGAPAVPAAETLPGAEQDPCCMGTAAREELEVLEGFIEAELADRRGVSMTEISLAWLLTKVTAPVVGATKLHHIEGAAKAVDLELTSEECAYLEEPYIPHPLVGVMAQNTPAAAKESHVWSTGDQKI